MQKTTCIVIVALILGVTIILTALILKWYLIQKTVYDNGYSQVMEPYATTNVPVWVKK